MTSSHQPNNTECRAGKRCSQQILLSPTPYRGGEIGQLFIFLKRNMNSYFPTPVSPISAQCFTPQVLSPLQKVIPPDKSSLSGHFSESWCRRFQLCLTGLHSCHASTICKNLSSRLCGGSISYLGPSGNSYICVTAHSTQYGQCCCPNFGNFY